MEMKIKLNGIQEVKEFVTAAGKCDFDIDIFYNRVVIDAKSILGILSMDLNRVLTVRCYGTDQEFWKILEKYSVQKAVA
ncbi:MAG: HPr family phosphocarrier protein [Lachnospiraceae bacterium]|nr:HPr family phosphocarrier protein [Lachnospiraceae bacterium]